MDSAYKIEVRVTPSPSENKTQPYFWILYVNSGQGWSNSTAGWANSPEEAWNEAYSFYLSYKI